MSVVAFIPCRSGSKRIPRKNLQIVGGVSLLERAVDCARKAGIERIVISTDNANFPLRFEEHETKRAPELHVAGPPIHTDTAQIEDAIAHWLARATVADEDVITLLQCTTPFRRAATVRACVEWVRSGRDDVCVAVTRDVARVHFNGRVRGVFDDAQGCDVGYRVLWNNPPSYRPRSQDCVNDGVDRGTCWAFRAGHFRATGFRMAPRTGAVFVTEVEALDIDTPGQLEHARVIAPHVERLIAMEG